MKQYSRYITLIGGILAFLSFSMPWVEDDVYAGIEYVHEAEFFPTIVFIASLIVIVIGIYMLTQQTPRKSRKLIFISSSIGIGCALLLMLFINPASFMRGNHRADMYGIFVMKIKKLNG
jgi:hypothetical protein